jgi:hypothetical protein
LPSNCKFLSSNHRITKITKKERDGGREERKKEGKKEREIEKIGNENMFKRYPVIIPHRQNKMVQ